MARKAYEAGFRMEVVRRYWAGEPISLLARQYGLSRETVYRWARRAEEAALEALRDRPPLRRGDGK